MLGADVLLLRHAVDAELAVEQVDPVIVGELRPLERDVDQLQAAIAQLRRVLRDRRRQRRRASCSTSCRQRQRRQHAAALDRLLAAVLACRRRARSGRRRVRAAPPATRAARSCRASYARPAMFSNSTLMPLPRIHVLGEVGRRIGLDAERAQDDVLQVQLGDALRLLRRNLRRRQPPDALRVDPEAQVVERAARGCGRPTPRTSALSSPAPASTSCVATM